MRMNKYDKIYYKYFIIYIVNILYNSLIKLQKIFKIYLKSIIFSLY